MEEVREELNRRTCYDASRTLLWCSFGLFMFFLLWIILLKACRYENLTATFGMQLAQQDLRTRFLYQFDRDWSWYGTIYGIRDVSLNILLMLPLGIYLPLLFKRYRLSRDVIISFFFILTLELIELFDRLTVMDFMDIISNMVGMLLGSLIFAKVIAKQCTAKVVNGINIGIITIATPLAIWAAVHTLTHIEWYYMYYGVIPIA